MHDSCLLYLKRVVVLRVISSCAQVKRGCYTPYTAVLPASTPCTLVHVDAGATANTIMRNSWRYCILFHVHLLLIVTPSTRVILSRLLRYGLQSDSILEPRTPYRWQKRCPAFCHREIRKRIAPAMGSLAPHNGFIYRWLLWTVGVCCSYSCVDARHMGRTPAVSPQTLDLCVYSPVRGPHFWHCVHSAAVVLDRYEAVCSVRWLERRLRTV